MQKIAPSDTETITQPAPGEEMPDAEFIGGLTDPSVDNHFEGINVSGATVTQATDHLPEEQRSLIRWLFHHARQNKLSWDDLARATNVSSTTLYRIFRDKYKNPKSGTRVSLEDVCAKVSRYRNIVTQREVVASDFIETSVSERIFWLCNRAFVRQKIGFVYGESQAGKTTGLIEFQRRNNHGQTTYLEMPPSSGVQLMTKYIARALFVSEKKSFDHLLDEVIQALDSSKLLIVDEIHRVFTTYQKGSVMRCLDVLRHIHDKTKCGMVLCGTNAFRNELQRGEFSQYLKQLKRRGLYELQLPTEPPRSDLDLFAGRYGLKPATGEAEEIMIEIGKRDGIGAFITRLQDAVELAGNKRQAVSWEHFIKAHNIVKKMAMKVK